jgi:hypothetical protein
MSDARRFRLRFAPFLRSSSPWPLAWLFGFPPPVSLCPPLFPPTPGLCTGLCGLGTEITAGRVGVVGFSLLGSVYFVLV